MTERHVGAMEWGIIARWAAIYALTEAATVGVAIAVGATTVPLVALTALVEGLLLGSAQATFALGLRGRRALVWSAATVTGVMLGRLLEYACATSPLATALGGTPLAAQAVAGSALGFVAGAIFAAFQAPLLGPSAAHARRWPLVSAVAWALTFPLLLLIGVVTQGLASAPLAVQAAIDVVLFAVAGALVGALNGYGLRYVAGVIGAQRSSTARRLFSRTGFAR
ncbi:MAG: hypothetical protein ABSH03_09070 [Candidatus Lustribacter sp.]|jgi:F0F1-type ATP synthase assembly protein I